ncbi:RNase H-like domain-containing protein, partial [Bartonella sp. CL45QHWL]|uniref:RNase H-like domain-containing protein n=1 Tax=Bartonella sp. CL45QHWL TaxID=3243533 RepID=UPI0035D0F428
MNQRDDILLGGKDQDEHDHVLEQVLQRADDYGVTFNWEKAEIGKASIDFYGNKFTDEGLKPSADKVKAIQDSKPPESKSAVRSFLGMVGYLSKFIPRYSSLTAPLRALTHKNSPFKWGVTEANAFSKLKASITSHQTIAYFDPAKPIIVRTEASFNEGIAAGLFQKTEKGLQPVHFISRTLTNCERRYSQT